MSANTGSQQGQLNSQNQLQTQAQTNQNQLLQQNNAAFSPYLSGNSGFTPSQLANLNSQALDQNALRYNQANQMTNAQVSARGDNGLTPMSGVGAGQYASLNASRAGDLADSLRTVSLNNSQQALANQFNAGSLLSGNAQTYAGNVGTYGSGASNALNSLTTAQQGGFFNNFMKGLGGGLGSGASTAALGGLGTAASNVGSGNYGW